MGAKVSGNKPNNQQLRQAVPAPTPLCRKTKTNNIMCSSKITRGKTPNNQQTGVTVSTNVDMVYANLTSEEKKKMLSDYRFKKGFSVEKYLALLGKYSYAKCTKLPFPEGINLLQKIAKGMPNINVDMPNGLNSDNIRSIQTVGAKVTIVYKVPEDDATQYVDVSEAYFVSDILIVPLCKIPFVVMLSPVSPSVTNLIIFNPTTENVYNMVCNELIKKGIIPDDSKEIANC